MVGIVLSGWDSEEPRLHCERHRVTHRQFHLIVIPDGQYSPVTPTPKRTCDVSYIGNGGGPAPPAISDSNLCGA